MNSKRKYYYQMIACLSKQCWSELQALFAEKMQKKPSSISQLDALAISEIRGASVRSPPPSFPDQIQYGVSLSLSSEAEEDGSVFFFSSIRNQFPLPGMDGERKGPPRENKSHFSLSLSLHLRREEKMPPSSISPLGKSTRTLYSVFVWYSSVCGNLLIIFRSSFRPHGEDNVRVLLSILHVV